VHPVKAYGGVELLIHSLVTLTLDGGDWSASGPGRFASEELKYLNILKLIFYKSLSQCV
jgi:hypothetical protein